MKTIIVIGSNSFSGSHFVNHALEIGMNVAGISRSDEPIDAFLPYKNNNSIQNFHFFKMDLNHDLDKIMTVIMDFKPDYVVNFAAQSMVAESWLFPEQWFQTNVVANVKFHDKLRKCSFIKKYIHVSTPEVYGACSGIIKEDAPLNPSTPYAVSRAACDMSLLSFFKNYNFPVVFTRAANVFGPGQQLYRIIPKTILSIKSNTKLQLHGGGHSTRSFIHIRDVVKGTMKITIQSDPGEVYHLSTNQFISIRSLVELICKKLDVDFNKNVEIVGERPGKDSAYLLDSSKALKTFGWQPEINLEEGISETISWIDNNFSDIINQPKEYIHKA